MVVNKTANHPVNYQLSLVASAFMQEMSSRTALKQYKFTGSEEDLTQKDATSVVCKVKHAKVS